MKTPLCIQTKTRATNGGATARSLGDRGYFLAGVAIVATHASVSFRRLRGTASISPWRRRRRSRLIRA
ncbi:hypothetical protein LSAT2_015226 [Lamellibrachia satsuma]|nr:hypothetical protein LSAT2_015226 [Lamellibrachia satsuma]